MKIVIVTFTYDPSRDGVAQSCSTMADSYACAGHEVFIVTNFLTNRIDFTPAPRIHIKQFHAERSTVEALHMEQYILKIDPSLIICHCWPIWSTNVAERTFSRLRARRILVSHGYNPIWKPHRRFPWGLKTLAFGLLTTLKFVHSIRRYDRVVFSSSRSDWSRHLDYRIAAILRHPGLTIIPNSTDAEPDRASPEDFRTLHGLQDTYMVLCVSNYFPGKNQSMGLRAFRKARLGKASLVFIGSEFSEYCRSLMRLEHLTSGDPSGGKILFFEKLDRLNIMAAYAACDVFLLTSKSETGPIVILEAMAAGKPFITTNVGIVSQLPGGLICKSENEVSQALRQLRDCPTLRTSLGEEGKREVLTHYTRERVQAMHRALLDDLFPVAGDAFQNDGS